MSHLDCPEHGEGWPCPDDCKNFLAELDRRVKDVAAGNFIRTWQDSDAGVWFRQEFRNHVPVGQPRLWPAKRRD